MPVLPLFGRILIRIMHNDAGKCILRGSDIRLLEKSLPNEAGKMLGKRIEMSAFYVDYRAILNWFFGQTESCKERRGQL